MVATVTLLAAVAAPATSRASSQSAEPKPCSGSTVGGATVLNWCGPAKATVKLAGKTLRFKGGVCAAAKVSGIPPTWTLNIGRFTSPPAKPKFSWGTPVSGSWSC